MSNYPDGVTGNEPQIAGSDEREIRMEVECDNEDWSPPDGLPGTTACGFSGHTDVTETITHRGRDEIIGTREWTCPRCSTEHLEDNIVLAERGEDEL